MSKFNRLIKVSLATAFFVSPLLAQEIDNQEESDFVIEILSLPSEMCDDYLSNKGWTTGLNTLKGGKEVYFAVGFSGIKAPKNSPRYVDSIQNAYTSAALQAKKELAEYWGKEVTNDLKTSLVERLSEGKKPQDLLAEEKSKNEDGELSLLEKARLIMHQKLNDMMSDETQEKIENDQLEAEELARAIDNITDQNSFQQTVNTSAQAQIRGMKTTYAGLSETGVCAVSAWSENTSKQADALATGDFKILQNLKPGKPFSQRIPNHKSAKGVEKLLSRFGAYIARNENGEIGVISYGQASAMRSDPTAMKSAMNVAKLKAEAQIAQLSKENVDVRSKLEDIEIETGFKNSDMKDYYSERNTEERIAASSKLKVSGVVQYGTWAIPAHPITKKPVAGVILTWTPSDSNLAKKMKKTDSTSSSSKPSGGSWSEETGMTGGGSSGDDEEDF